MRVYACLRVVCTCEYVCACVHVLLCIFAHKCLEKCINTRILSQVLCGPVSTPVATALALLSRVRLLHGSVEEAIALAQKAHDIKAGILSPMHFRTLVFFSCHIFAGAITSRTYTFTQMHVHAHTCAQAHEHAHTRTHSHSHSHSLAYFSIVMCSDSALVSCDLGFAFLNNNQLMESHDLLETTAQTLQSFARDHPWRHRVDVSVIIIFIF